jgi:ATP-binding protein involved in chromosome partitioning
MILPPIAHDVKVISIGMFLDGATAVSWRGPMLHRTIQQFLTDVYFGDLDILLIDLPPGTGDIAISLGQLLPQAEVIVVTTPQTAAAEVAERSAIVARQTGQRVIGVIENMSGLPQPDGTVLELFGSGGGSDVAARLSTPDQPVTVLGRVPLSIALREGGDRGQPVVLEHPDDLSAVEIAAIAGQLAQRGRGLAGRKLGLGVNSTGSDAR